MRVLLCHQPIDGGVGRHIRDLADGLTAAGHEVTLCSPAPSGAAWAARSRTSRSTFAARPRRARDLAALARLAAIVRSVRPQVVHAHSSKAGSPGAYGPLRQPAGARAVLAPRLRLRGLLHALGRARRRTA